MDTQKRPLGVWIIAVFYLLSAGWTLLSYILIFGGIIAINEAQRIYFASLGLFDWITTILIMILSLSAAISLFLLRKISVFLFSIVLFLNTILTLLQILQTNWAEAVGIPGLIGVIIGWMILIIIFLYAKNLAKKQILS